MSSLLESKVAEIQEQSRKNILAIDPGTTHSGVVEWNPITNTYALIAPHWPNNDLLDCLRRTPGKIRVVCEWIQAMGMPVGQEVFLTCRLVGRIEEICASKGRTVEYITRPTVKARLCGSARAKDQNVRQALIDRVGPVGTKKSPGPLFGVSSHSWSALACAIAIDLQ